MNGTPGLHGLTVSRLCSAAVIICLSRWSQRLAMRSSHVIGTGISTLSRTTGHPRFKLLRAVHFCTSSGGDLLFCDEAYHKMTVSSIYAGW